MPSWKDTVTNYEPEYKNSDWRAMSAMLQQNSAKPKRNYRMWFLFAIAGICLFIGGFFSRDAFDYLQNADDQQMSLIDSTHQSAPENALQANNSGNDDEHIITKNTGTSNDNKVANSDYSPINSEINSKANDLSVNKDALIDKINTKRASKKAPTKVFFNSFKDKQFTDEELPSNFANNLFDPFATNNTGKNKNAFLSLNNSFAKNKNGQAQQNQKDSVVSQYVVANDTLLGMNPDQTKGTDDIKPKAITPKDYLAMQFSVFYQMVGVKKASLNNNQSNMPLNMEHEVGLDVKIGKLFYTGIGYGFHSWNSKPQLDEISKYQAHVPFIKFGIDYSLNPQLSIYAHLGNALAFEQITYLKSNYISGENHPVTSVFNRSDDRFFYGVGCAYTFKAKHSLYATGEMGSHRFSLGYKYNI